MTPLYNPVHKHYDFDEAALDRLEFRLCLEDRLQGHNGVKNFTVLICFVLSSLIFPHFFHGSETLGEGPYLDAVRDIDRWLRALKMPVGGINIWPSIPGDKASVNSTLYSGVPGIVLFYLEAFALTRDQEFSQEARAGADYLLQSLGREKSEGLYAGLAGIGYALGETYRLTEEGKYREGLRRCLRILQENAIEKGAGIEWSPVTDIISGSAGTGLFLVYASRLMGENSWLELACGAGSRLIELGIPAEEGLKWSMSPDYPRMMPNFAHGTAGIAYFLATLHQETGEEKYLDAALKGARYLQAAAKTDGGGCLILHHEPDGEDLFYLGWCHGPVGTARLFFRLYQITKDEEWMDWVAAGARSILKSGIPETKVPGFWNNVGICCGSAGIAEFMLDLHRLTNHADYLEFAGRMTAEIMEKATRDESGIRWIHAEHRSRPDFVMAQTGLMQGAAGIGIWLLHLHAFEEKLTPGLIFPDSPFSYRGPMDNKNRTSEDR